MHIEAITASIGDKQLPLKLASFASKGDLDLELEALGNLTPGAPGAKDKSSHGIVYLEAELASFDRARSSLCLLRASNLSPILLLKVVEPPPTDIEIETVIPFLRDWDQLFLFNILALFQSRLPVGLLRDLEIEAKIELKWFREWLVANQDPRLSRYPGLPWRSFIRKVIQENFAFCQTLMQVEDVEAERASLENTVRGFLKSRKKAICFFPKKWSQSQ